MKTELIEKDGVYTLKRGENILQCPFKTSQAIQGNFKNIAFVSQSCDSNCPHFYHEQNNNREMVEITCSGNEVVVYMADKQKEATEKDNW